MNNARSILAVLFIAVLIGLSVLPVRAAPMQAPTSPGTTNLSAWWSLNETSGTRNDSHGSNNLTDNNTVTYATGKQGNAAYFMAANSESLSIADNAALSTGNIDFTVCTWAYLSSKTTNGEIINKWSSGTYEWRLLYIQATDRFGFRISSDGSSTIAGVASANTLGSPSANTWYFICGIHDAANDTLKVYVNGTSDSVAYSSGLIDGTSITQIGNASTGIYYGGYVDEALLYKKVLSTDELDWLYNSGSGRAYCEVANNCATATPTATATATHTSTPTLTPTPSACANGGTITSSTWTVTSGVNNDTCTDNAVRYVWQEPTGSGTTVDAAWTGLSAGTIYDLTWNGYYTGAHTVKLQCQNTSTSAWVDVMTIGKSLSADESITAEMSQSCNDGSPTLRFYHVSAGSTSHYLYIDQLVLNGQNATATPTSTSTYTPTATYTPTETLTPTATGTETLTPTITNTPHLTHTPSMGTAMVDSTITYGDYATTTAISLLCLVVIVGFVTWLIITTLQRRRRA